MLAKPHQGVPHFAPSRALRAARRGVRGATESAEFAEVPAIIVNVSADDLQLTGWYESIGDVVYLSAPADDKGPRRAHDLNLSGSGLPAAPRLGIDGLVFFPVGPW